MKPTADDAQPRRDGWFEHKATWGEVTVGTVLASKLRSERWEVVETANGAGPIPFNHTLWFRIREMTTGEFHAVPPKNNSFAVTILTQDPRDTKTAPPTEPSDSEAVLLLARELGAEVMATRHHETGAITCPDYVYDSHLPKDHSHVVRGLVEHMRFAHKMSVDGEIGIEAATQLHGQAHNPKWPNIGKGGFAHQHIHEII